MDTLRSAAGEVEAAMAGGDAAQRTAVLRRVVGLFVEQAPSLGDGHVALFDEVILRLSRDLEFRARVDLAERLASVERAPPGIVKRLALDDAIEVASPVIAGSPRLSEADLVEIAQSKGQDHLRALCLRPVLTERVTDVIVDRGDAGVVRSIAGHGGARFSERGLDRLVDKARADPHLNRLLAARQDLPPEALAILVRVAQERVSAGLTGELGASAAAAVGAAVASASGQLPARDAALSKIRRPASARPQTPPAPVTEEDVLEHIRAASVDQALDAMAQLAEVPVELARSAYHASTYDPLLFLTKSLRFGWVTFKALLILKAGRLPPEPMLKAAFESYQKLSVQTARRVVRFTALREHAARSTS